MTQDAVLWLSATWPKRNWACAANAEGFTVGDLARCKTIPELQKFIQHETAATAVFNKLQELKGEREGKSTGGGAGIRGDMETTLTQLFRAMDVAAAAHQCPPSLTVAAVATVNFEHLGALFPFVNREAECIEVLRLLWAMETLRGKGCEGSKRDLRYPVCLGLACVGKTRFARVFLLHLAEIAAVAAGKKHSDFEDLLSVASDVAKTAFGARNTPAAAEVQFVQRLLAACFNGCNVRLDGAWFAQTCDQYAPERVMCAMVLAEHFKYRRAVRTDRSDYVLSLLESWEQDGRSVWFHHELNRILSEAFAGDLSKYSPGAIILNIDEAQRMSDRILARLLDVVSRAFLEHGLPIYVVFTGISGQEIRSAFVASNVSGVDVVLPLLSQFDMSTILGRVFSDELKDGISVQLSLALFWLGGVPRHLEYFLRYFAEIALTTPERDRQDLRALWGALSASNWEAVVSAVNRCAMLLAPSARGNVLNRETVLSTIFSLAVSGCVVDSSTVIGKLTTSDGTPRDLTLEIAQSYNMLYFQKSAPGDVGTVRLPPVLYSAIQNGAMPALLPHVSLLASAIPAMTPTMNEKTTMTAILHRMRAAVFCNKTRVALKELLGGLPPALENIQVTLPRDMRRLMIVPLNHQISTFADFQKFESDSNTSGGPIAFLNGAQAPYCDWGIVLPELDLLGQDKQAVVARRARIEGGAIAAVAASAIAAEYAKCTPHSKHHLFIFVTDEICPEASPNPSNVVVYDNRSLDLVLGSTLAVLRSFAVDSDPARAYGELSGHLALCMVPRETPRKKNESK